MALPKEIVTKFTDIARYPLSEYLDSYVELISKHRINILNYYAGNVSRPNESSFKLLKRLLKQAELVNDMIELHKDRLNTGAFWELIEVLTNVQSSLWTIENSSKWLRSAISKNNFTPEVEINYVMKQLETIESVSSTIGSNDRESDWVTIALRNDLIEEDYTSEGGNSLLVGYKNKLAIRLNSVVDNISGLKIYGADLDKKITFENDDLRVLDYKSTIKQAVSILANLKQGSTPEFPEDGIQSSLVVGSNKSSIVYPILYRQLYATFRRDDTLKSLTITDVKSDTDALHISFSIETRLGEELEETIQL